MRFLKNLLLRLDEHTAVVAEAAELRRELERTQRDHGTLQGRNIELTSEVSQLREERDKAADRERETYQLMINQHYQGRYGYVPYPNAPHIPDEGIPEPASGSMGGSTNPRALSAQIAEEQMQRALDHMAKEVVFKEQ